ncbi:MAG: hypothetical protein ACFFD1_11775 [Candidatus Thorarchaeota archaeon]
MSEAKLISIFIQNLQFRVEDYLVEEITDLQKEVIDDATFIFKENIAGEIKTFGGSVKKNEEKFDQMMKEASEELKKEKYQDVKKILKDYLKKLSEVIIKSCVAIIPVKELPWEEVIFRSIPRIEIDGNVEFTDHTIAYYGEIKCVLGKTILFGKIKDKESLFSPVMGNLDLGSYKIDDSIKGPKSHNYSYISAILQSFDSVVTQNQLAKYDEDYQRHGDPICDFLMNDEDLLKVMDKVATGMDLGRITSEISISSIAFPIPTDKRTLMIVANERDAQEKYTQCFEALLKFSAASCQAPSPPTAQDVQSSEVIKTPGGQELKAWTAEELANEAKKRLESKPDMPTWSEEELSKFSEERGSGIPEGMEVWTEDELQELAEKRRGGGLNIPEWKPDEDMLECKNCGYALRPGWKKCPICDTPVNASTKEEPDHDEDQKEAPSSENIEESSDTEESNNS